MGGDVVMGVDGVEEVEGKVMVRGVDYRCTVCQRSGMKLWRQIGFTTDGMKLKCARCIAPDVLVDEKGFSGSWGLDGKFSGPRSDQMESKEDGGMLPAIPAGEGSFWGYSSVPEKGVEWWRDLPTYSYGRDDEFDVAAWVQHAEERLRAGEEAHRVRRDQEWQEHRDWAAQMMRDTVYVVRAGFEEGHHLWGRHSVEGAEFYPDNRKHIQKRQKWKQESRGYCHSLPDLVVNGETYPHCVTLHWWWIDGKLVVFYEGTSLVVHHGLVEEWVEKAFAGVPKTNVANFGHCLPYLRGLK